MSKPRRFIRAIIGILNPHTWGVFTETYEQTKFDAAFSISYSQGAEDISLLSIMLSDLTITNNEDKTYIDVGAHDPNRFSVTRRLYDLGWSGVNIDANKELEAKFLKWRKRDIFIWSAVGREPEYTFYTFEERAISTSNQDWKNGAIKGGNKIVREEKVPGQTLRHILETNFPNGVALLNIDIEGSDDEALYSLELENLPDIKKPKWLLLETSPPVATALNAPAVIYATTNGYIPWLVLGMGTLLKKTGN